MAGRLVCPRDAGKGQFESNNSIQGKVISVGSADEEEIPNTLPLSAS